jgi:hypothetical protein
MTLNIRVDWFYYGESDYCVSPHRMPDYDLCEKFGEI